MFIKRRVWRGVGVLYGGGVSEGIEGLGERM